MKFPKPRFSMRVMVVVMLLVGAGLGLLGRELFHIRTRSEQQLEAIRVLKEKGVDIDVYERKDLTLLESIAQQLDHQVRRTNVLAISLRSGKFSDEEMAQMADLNGLQHFFDSTGCLTDKIAAKLGNCRELKEVWLDKWNGPPEGIAALLSGSAPLESVVIGRTSINDYVVAIAARKMTLQRIYFDGRDVTCEGLKQLSRSPSLKRIDLQHGKALAKGFAAFSNHSSVRDLRLHQYEFGKEDLSTFGTLNQIEYLSIESEQFPLGILSAVGKCRRLKKLVLVGKMPPDELIPIGGFPELESLSIHSPVAKVSELAGLIRELPKLRTINLPKAVFSSTDLDVLSAMQNLQTVVVASGTPVEGISQFQRSATKCKVTVVYPDGRRFLYSPKGAGPTLLVRPAEAANGGESRVGEK